MLQTRPTNTRLESTNQSHANPRALQYLHSVRVVGAAVAAGNRSADLAYGEPNGEPTPTDTSERPRTLGTLNWLVRNVFYTSVNVYGQLMGP